jgi:hypothetical protein
METIQPRYETLSRTESFSDKNYIILVLVGLLVLSFVGINVLDVASNVIKAVIAILGPLVARILAAIGYTTGTVINKTADVVSDTAKSGIDIAEGTVQDVGNLMISASASGVDSGTKKNLDMAINSSKRPGSHPDPDSTENPIQNPISSKKGAWCLVGEYKNKRGCVEVSNASKCMSEQVFPTQKMCLNPTKGA